MSNEIKTGTVFHEIRGEQIFLCISCDSDSPAELARTVYAVERELLPERATPEGIRELIDEMAAETGLHLSPSSILKHELGIQ